MELSKYNTYKTKRFIELWSYNMSNFKELMDNPKIDHIDFDELSETAFRKEIHLTLLNSSKKSNLKCAKCGLLNSQKDQVNDWVTNQKSGCPHRFHRECVKDILNKSSYICMICI